MFYADKPRRSEKSRDIWWATRIGTLRPALRLIPALNMHKLYWPSENKMAAYLLLRIGWVPQRIRRYLHLFHLWQYFKGKKIRRILKLYGLFLHKIIFLGANGSLPRFFSDMWPPKFLTAKNWLPVRLNGFWRRLNGFQNNRLTTGLIHFKNVTLHLYRAYLYYS